MRLPRTRCSSGSWATKSSRGGCSSRRTPNSRRTSTFEVESEQQPRTRISTNWLPEPTKKESSSAAAQRSSFIFPDTFASIRRNSCAGLQLQRMSDVGAFRQAQQGPADDDMDGDQRQK